MQTPSTSSDVSVPPDTLSSEGQSGSGNDGAQTSVEGGLVNVGVSVSVDSDDDSGKPKEGGSEDVSKTSDVGAIPTTVQTPSTSSDVSLPPDTLSSEGQGGSGNDGAQTSVKGGLINVGVSVSVDSDDGSGKPKEGGSEDGSKTSDVGETPSTMQTPSTSSDVSVLSDTSSPSTESGSSNQGAQTSVEGGLINVGVSVSVDSDDSSGKPKEGGSEHGSKTLDVGEPPSTMQAPSTSSDDSVLSDTSSPSTESGSSNQGAQTSVDGGLINVGVSVSVDSDDGSGKPKEGGSEDGSKTLDVGELPSTMQTPSKSSDDSVRSDKSSPSTESGSSNQGAQTSAEGGLINVGVSVSVDSDDGSGKPKEGGSEDGSKTSVVGKTPSTMQTPSTSSDDSVLSDTSAPSTESGSSNQGAQTSVEGGLINVGVSVSVESGDSSGKPKEGGSEDGSKTSDVNETPPTMQPSTLSDVSVPSDTSSREAQIGSGNDGAQTSVEGGLVNVGVSVSVVSDDVSGKSKEGGSEDGSKTSVVGKTPSTMQTPSTSSDDSVLSDTSAPSTESGSSNQGAQTSVEGGLINVGVSVSVESGDSSGKPKEGGSEDGSKISDVGETPPTMQTPSTSSHVSVPSDTSSPVAQIASGNDGAQTTVEGGLINVGVSESVVSDDCAGKSNEGGLQAGSKSSVVAETPSTMQTPSTSSAVSVPSDTSSSGKKSSSNNEGAQSGVGEGIISVGASLSVVADGGSGKGKGSGSSDGSMEPDLALSENSSTTSTMATTTTTSKLPDSRESLPVESATGTVTGEEKPSGVSGEPVFTISDNTCCSSSMPSSLVKSKESGQLDSSHVLTTSSSTTEGVELSGANRSVSAGTNVLSVQSPISEPESSTSGSSSTVLVVTSPSEKMEPLDIQSVDSAIGTSIKEEETGDVDGFAGLEAPASSESVESESVSDNTHGLYHVETVSSSNNGSSSSSETGDRAKPSTSTTGSEIHSTSPSIKTTTRPITTTTTKMPYTTTVKTTTAKSTSKPTTAKPASRPITRPSQKATTLSPYEKYGGVSVYKATSASSNTLSETFLYGGVFSFLSGPLLITRMELPRYLHVGHRTPSQRSFCLEECSPSCQDRCSLRGWSYLDIFMLATVHSLREVSVWRSVLLPVRAAAHYEDGATSISSCWPPYTLSEKFLFRGVFSFLSGPLLITRMELPRYLHVGHRTLSQRSFCLEECSPSCPRRCSLRGWSYLDIFMLATVHPLREVSV
ncbi:hypothetical protein J6590_095751 [Homalodisca vitripennis]|nr:hypothetical protein J6590_095751 [Homalodisca vitripennis]